MIQPTAFLNYRDSCRVCNQKCNATAQLCLEGLAQSSRFPAVLYACGPKLGCLLRSKLATPWGWVELNGVGELGGYDSLLETLGGGDGGYSVIYA
jgi:hypothetical protein